MSAAAAIRGDAAFAAALLLLSAVPAARARSRR